jgi:hypothetical protein
VCALIWAVWNVWNDFIFNKKTFSSSMQVIPLATHWIHMWSFLQPDSGCNRLHMAAWDLYSQFGWHATRRLT